MKGKVFLVSTAAAVGVFSLGATIGWAATNTSHPSTTSGKAAMGSMHSAKTMRSHMQAVHPSLTSSQIDPLVAECQKAMAQGSMPDEMMGTDNMMGSHASHHSGSTTSGMMGSGMMG